MNFGVGVPMTGEDNDLMFADDEDILEVEEESRLTHISEAKWPILIVDDEPEVHSMTKMLLAAVRFRERELEFISAHSAHEAKTILQDRRDIAVIMLDVVMETDDAGLKLVREIRDDLDNRHVRIILRTGQPGQAPERDVILDYDINDYKSKTELTSQKLFTSTIAALRAYEDIMALETTRSGLENVLEASGSLFKEHSIEHFAKSVLKHLSTLLGVEEKNGFVCVQGRDAREKLTVLACGEETKLKLRSDLDEKAFSELYDKVQRALIQKNHLFEEDSITIFFKTSHHRSAVLNSKIDRALTDIDKQLIEVFCSKVSICFDNLFLFEQLKKSQQATVIALADLAEFKDTDTGEHVLRVERLTTEITRRLRDDQSYPENITDLFLEQIGMASILHDVGKVSIPDNVLQKPGPLDPNERIIMEDHASAGGRILENAANLIEGSTYLSLGSEIASGHHEWFDGSGYPKGLKGEEIPLSARIVAVADVFDALVNRRPYKEPWSKEKAVAYIHERSGTQFDPHVVTAFLAIVDSYLQSLQ